MDEMKHETWLAITLFDSPAAISEDSDYTSDINYTSHPGQGYLISSSDNFYHGVTSSINAQQYRRDDDNMPRTSVPHQENYYSKSPNSYSQQNHLQPQHYSTNNMALRCDPNEVYSRQDVPYQQTRSDSESEPFSYNSRPRSYFTERLIMMLSIMSFLLDVRIILKIHFYSNVIQSHHKNIHLICLICIKSNAFMRHYLWHYVKQFWTSAKWKNGYFARNILLNVCVQ